MSAAGPPQDGNQPVSISAVEPGHPDVRRLLDEGEMLMARLYPAESNHILDRERLFDRDVHFVGAMTGGRCVGCGALVAKAEYGEIKRMFVDPLARGQRIGGRILTALEDIAARQGIPVVRLETGVLQPAAIALYRRAGYRECPPFGDYGPDPNSLFMEKHLLG